jgi:hypothetical protein
MCVSNALDITRQSNQGVAVSMVQLASSVEMHINDQFVTGTVTFF